MTKSEYKIISGKKLIHILEKHFNFDQVSQKGSHIKLKNKTKGTIVPNHKEIAYGTFKSILDLAEISEKEFYKKQKIS